MSTEYTVAKADAEAAAIASIDPVMGGVDR